MFKYIALLSLIAVAVAKPGHLATHSVVESAHVGSVVHSVPSAVSSQHITRVHNSAVVTPVVAPVVKTYVAAPAVHTSPVVHSAPVVHASPVLHLSSPVVHSAPVVHAAPVVHSSSVVHSAPVLHAAPVVHSVHSAPFIKTVLSPVAYNLHH